MYQNELLKYGREKMKLKLLTLDINFLKDCKRRKVFPNFIQIKTSLQNQRAKDAERAGKRAWLRRELDHLYSKRSSVEFEVYLLNLKLSKNLSDIEAYYFLNFERVLIDHINKEYNLKKIRLNKKFKTLIEGSSNQRNIYSNSVPSYIENLVKIDSQNIILNEDELKTLNKGLNFAFAPIKPPIEEIAADVEIGILHLPEDEKNSIRLEVKNLLTQHVPPNINKNNKGLLNTIKNIKNKNGLVMKADKGNSVVVLTKDDYIFRMNLLLQEGSYKKLLRNPLPKMISSIDECLKKWEIYIADKFWRRNMKNSNPQVPKLYGLPKIHKPGQKMRPIVSNLNAPTQKLSRWLHSQFALLGKLDGFRIQNREELIERTKNVCLNQDEILVSFDVTALFPSVPIPETLIVLREWLNTKDLTSWKRNMLIELTELCMNQNIFVFNKEFYKQDEGTAMGNNLSPFIADLFLWHFENLIKHNIDFPRVWLRYVDDIFAITTSEKVPNILNLINNQFPTIKFTVELEKNKKLPFLDILIERTNENRLEYNIFRKPTQTKRYITSDSHHSFAQKYASMNSMIHRLVYTPLSYINFNIELDYILDCAKLNGLDTKIIMNTVKKKIEQRYKKENITLETNTSLVEVQNIKRVKMVFYPLLTNDVSKVLGKHNIKVAYKSEHTIKNAIGSTKDKTDVLEKSGIYKLDCSGCDAIYIGQTSRSVKKRLRDHKLDVQNNTEKSAFAKHVRFENNSLGRGRRNQKPHGIIDESKITLLKEAQGFRKLNVWESIYINKLHNHALNDNFGFADSALLKLFKTNN